ncbi:hypothetical protein NKH18_22315 [Streptomyces sp. M10(2022)]
MKDTAAASDSADPDLELLRSPYLSTIADWAWRVFLAVGVLIIGLVAATLGPLFAVACDTCQDGVHGELRFKARSSPSPGTGCHSPLWRRRSPSSSPGGTRAALIGIGVMALLLLVLMALGEYGA